MSFLKKLLTTQSHREQVSTEENLTTVRSTFCINGCPYIVVQLFCRFSFSTVIFCYRQYDNTKLWAHIQVLACVLITFSYHIGDLKKVTVEKLKRQKKRHYVSTQCYYGFFDIGIQGRHFAIDKRKLDQNSYKQINGSAHPEEDVVDHHDRLEEHAATAAIVFPAVLHFVWRDRQVQN